MSDQHEIYSQIFEVDRQSKEVNVEKHFFNKDTEIIKEGQRRKVVFGQMQQQPRSLIQIVSPYMSTIAQATGNFAYQAGSIAYEYLKQGFWWCYDQMTNKVIPYTRQQLPKLIFIISNKVSNKEMKSGQFCVLSMEEEDYEQIEKRKKNKRQGSIRVLVPLGEQDEALIKEIKRNYQVSESFPIDDEDEQQRQNDFGSTTFYIPSQRFEIIQEEARTIMRQRSKVLQVSAENEGDIKMKDLTLTETKQNTQIDHTNQQQNCKHEEAQLKNIDKKIEQVSPQQQLIDQQLKEQPKRKVVLLPQACVFQYQQVDQLYPFLMQTLQHDPQAIKGHLVSSSKFQKRESIDSNPSENSGEVPLLTVDNKIGERIVVMRQEEVNEVIREEVEYVVREEKRERIVQRERKVRVEVPRGEERLEQRENEELLLN